MSDESQRPLLHVIAIHGTFAGKARLRSGATDENEFYAETSDFAKTLTHNLSTNYDVNWHDYQWSGENSQSEREHASAKLNSFLKLSNIASNANILIIAHSHGGNVGFEWLTSSNNTRPTGLVSMGTPYVHLKKRRGFGKLSSYLRNILTVFGFPGFFILLFAQIFYNPESKFSSILIYTIWVVVFVLACIGVYYNSKQERLRREKRQLTQEKNIVAVCHPDDEAVAVLQSETKIPVSGDMVFKPFLSLGFPISVFVCIVLFLSTILGAHPPVIGGLIVPKPLNYILIFSLSAVVSAMGVFTILGLPMLAAKKYLKKRIGAGASNALSTALMKVGKGEDTDNPISLSKYPQCPDSNFTVIDESHDAILIAFKRTSDLASENIIKHKSAFISELLKTGGDLFSVLNNHPELGQSLIHCNYFTEDMAEFIGDNVSDWFDDKYTTDIVNPSA